MEPNAHVLYRRYLLGILSGTVKCAAPEEIRQATEWQAAMDFDAAEIESNAPKKRRLGEAA